MEVVFFKRISLPYFKRNSFYVAALLVLFEIKSNAKSDVFRSDPTSSKDAFINSIITLSSKSWHIISNISLSVEKPRALNSKIRGISSFT